MGYLIYLIPVYFLILMIFNFYRARKVKSQEDFMVAGRSLSTPVLVFTLVCTWIGSGTFIAGAEFSYRAGFSALWLAAGAWAGIVVIYFLAGRIRGFGQYTIGDILEVRYGKAARLLGSIALIISFTIIVSYQFRAGGIILNVITQDKENITHLTMQDGTRKTVKNLKLIEKEMAGYRITLENGSSKQVQDLIKMSGRYTWTNLSGDMDECDEAAMRESGPETFFTTCYTFMETDGSGRLTTIPAASVRDKEFKAVISVFWGSVLAAVFVILFTAVAGMIAVAYTDLPNGIIIVLACLVAVPFIYSSAGGLETARSVLPAEHFQIINTQFGAHPALKAGGYFLATFLLLLGVQSMYQKFYSARTARNARRAVVWWIIGTIIIETVVVVIAVFGASIFYNQGYDPASIVLVAATKAIPPYIGIFLLAAACMVVLSTGMNYLLSPTTNIMRDIYQRFLRPDATQRTMVFLQKIVVALLGIIALYLGLKQTSVLESAYFAYTIYGVAITPALIAALSWKRATRAGGLASIIGGAFVCLGLKILSVFLPGEMVPEGDPFGIPLIYPSIMVSLLCLIVVSYLTKPPAEADLKKIFKET